MSDTNVEARQEALEQARREMNEYLTYLQNVKRDSRQTVRSYRNDLKDYISWCERQGIDPIRATRQQMRKYLSDMVKAGYADASINHRLTSLRSFYRWLMVREKISVNEAESLSGRKINKTLPLAMSDDEVRQMIQACDDQSPEGLRDHAFIELMYATGGRISEMAHLEPIDIDFWTGEVHLFGKGRKERIVPVYKKALNVLTDYLEDARPILVDRASEGPEATKVFVSVNGKNMTETTLRARFERLVKIAGLKHPYTPHAMRHTYATVLLDGGADLKAVQELLGHESLATTQIYTHLSVDRLKQATKQAHPRG